MSSAPAAASPVAAQRLCVQVPGARQWLPVPTSAVAGRDTVNLHGKSLDWLIAGALGKSKGNSAGRTALLAVREAIREEHTVACAAVVQAGAPAESSTPRKAARRLGVGLSDPAEPVEVAETGSPGGRLGGRRPRRTPNRTGAVWKAALGGAAEACTTPDGCVHVHATPEGVSALMAAIRAEEAGEDERRVSARRARQPGGEAGGNRIYWHFGRETWFVKYFHAESGQMRRTSTGLKPASVDENGQRLSDEKFSEERALAKQRAEQLWNDLGESTEARFEGPVPAAE